MSTYERNGDRVDLIPLLEMGKRFQKEEGWVPPSKRAKAESSQGAEEVEGE